MSEPVMQLKTLGKLGAPQSAEAIALRRQGASWRSIAQRYRVDAKTVRRYCDPTFIHASNGRNEFLGHREAQEEHHRRMWWRSAVQAARAGDLPRRRLGGKALHPRCGARKGEHHSMRGVVVRAWRIDLVTACFRIWSMLGVR